MGKYSAKVVSPTVFEMSVDNNKPLGQIDKSEVEAVEVYNKLDNLCLWKVAWWVYGFKSTTYRLSQL